MNDDFKSINEPDSSKPATDIPGSINEPQQPAPSEKKPEKPEPKKEEPPHKQATADPDELEDELEQEIDDGDITRVTVTRVSKTAPKPALRKK